jgi:hypothetical protein
MQKWECRDLGEVKEFLSMRIRREGRSIIIDQQAYLQKVLKRLDLLNATPKSSPLPAGYNPEPNTAQAKSKNDRIKEYQTIIGSYLYLMIGTRPDIAFAVTKMAQFSANPTKDHLNRLFDIGRYLVGTQDYTLIYSGENINNPRIETGLTFYSDSDWASDKVERRSTTGYYGILAEGAICWVSHAQRTIALSSAEAEYMAISDCSRQAIWIRSLLSELDIHIGPVTIHGDSQSAIFIASNPVQEKQTKHIDIRYHFIREKVKRNEVILRVGKIIRGTL